MISELRGFCARLRGKLYRTMFNECQVISGADHDAHRTLFWSHVNTGKTERGLFGRSVCLCVCVRWSGEGDGDLCVFMHSGVRSRSSSSSKFCSYL